MWFKVDLITTFYALYLIIISTYHNVVFYTLFIHMFLLLFLFIVNHVSFVGLLIQNNCYIELVVSFTKKNTLGKMGD